MKRAFLLLLLLTCAVSVSADSFWRDKITPSESAAEHLFAFSVSVSQNRCIVGTPRDDENGIASGSAYIFRFDGNDWLQEQKLVPSDGSPLDEFGSSVSIHGDTCIVGSPADDDNGPDSGSVYVFRYSEPNWVEQAKLTASDGSAWAGFGASVSLCENLLVAGAPGYDDCGRAYIFRFNGSQWLREAELADPNITIDNEFGFAVSICSDVCIVADPNAGLGEAYSGTAYVYRFKDPNWVREDTLTAPSGSVGDFGSSVSIDGGCCIVGCPNNDINGQISGSAYVFRYNDVHNDPNWIRTQNLLPLDAEPNSLFGTSVSVSGDLCVVGAPYDNDNGDKSGSAYLFRLAGSKWTQSGKIAAFDGSVLDNFGASVSIDSVNLAAGAPGFNFAAGAAYTFIPCPRADLSGDCFVGLEDLFILARQWLTGADSL